MKREDENDRNGEIYRKTWREERKKVRKTTEMARERSKDLNRPDRGDRNGNARDERQKLE